MMVAMLMGILIEKTVPQNLIVGDPYYIPEFTLDVYGHVTEKMKQESAARMEQFIKAVNK